VPVSEKPYQGVQTMWCEIPSNLNFVIDYDEWSASSFGRFVPTNWIRSWADRGASPDMVTETKVSYRQSSEPKLGALSSQFCPVNPY
jgi:hypothetical protein